MGRVSQISFYAIPTPGVAVVELKNATLRMQHFLDMSHEQLAEWLRSKHFDTFRVGQVRQWLFGKRAAEFDAMTDLPLTLRYELSQSFQIWHSHIIEHSASRDGTEKLLLEFQAGGRIECVLLRDRGRRTICISTQVGCAMGCVFCASGLDGVDRNLTTGEILEQMLRLQRLLPPEERLSHVVVMGMGEPLANLSRLLPALELATNPAGLGISARRITISTVGLPEGIDQLTNAGSRYHLAVSLHAPSDALRNELVPVNKNIGLQRILAASDRYFARSGRRLTFEYVLLAGVNDRPEHAGQLAKLLRGRPALVNIIPYNPVDGLSYQTPAAAAAEQFRSILEAAHITVKFRQRKGEKINAACGQLRRMKASGSPKVVEITRRSPQQIS